MNNHLAVNVYDYGFKDFFITQISYTFIKSSLLEENQREFLKQLLLNHI